MTSLGLQDYEFRAGWLESELRDVIATMRAVLAILKDSERHSLTCKELEHRIKSGEETLAKVKQADDARDAERHAPDPAALNGSSVS